MLLSQHDYMVQALSPNRARKPFGKWILPRAVRCDHHFLNTHSFHPTTKILAIDLVSISQQVTWCRILWKGFCHLLPWRELASRGIYLGTNPGSSFFCVLTAAHGIHLLGGVVHGVPR